MIVVVKMVKEWIIFIYKEFIEDVIIAVSNDGKLYYNIPLIGWIQFE